MAASLKAELLKLGKRPAVWILLVILLALFVALSYFLVYALLANPPAGASQQQQIAENQLELLYPQNLSANVATGFTGSGVAGAAIALILGAMAVGGEYGWDTWKTALSRRPERLSFLSGKFVGVGVVLLVFVVLTFIVSAISSYIIASLENASVEWPVGEILKSFGATLLIVYVWAALGAFLAVLFRGTALAIGLGLVYVLVVEALAFSVLTGFAGDNKTLETIQKTLPGQNSNFLANSFAPESVSQVLGLREPLADPTQAALVLGAYLVAFVGISLLAFWRRDVT